MSNTDDAYQEFMASLKNWKPKPRNRPDEAKPLDPLAIWVAGVLTRFKSRGGGIVKLGEFVEGLTDIFPATGPADLAKRIRFQADDKEARNALFKSVRSILDAMWVRTWGKDFPPKYLIPKVLPVITDGKLVSPAEYEDEVSPPDTNRIVGDELQP